MLGFSNWGRPFLQFLGYHSKIGEGNSTRYFDLERVYEVGAGKVSEIQNYLDTKQLCFLRVRVTLKAQKFECSSGEKKSRNLSHFQ